MQKLLLLLLPLLPLAIVACTERDTVPANSAGSQARETYPQAPATAAPAAPATPGAAPSPATSPATLAPAQRTTLPGRGEGELESPAATDTVETRTDTVETRDEERNRAGSSDAAPIDPTRDSAIIDESGATGFGGRVMTPEALGDGELRLDDDDGTIEPDELPMLPADVVDAGPAMIP